MANTSTSDNAQPATSAAPLFEVGQCVRHIKSGGVYVILAGPDKIKLESDTQPAYAYQAVGDDGEPNGPIWVRAQGLMEDGRFELAPEVFVDMRAAPGQLLQLCAGPRVDDAVNLFAEVISVDGADLPEPCRWNCTAYVMARYTDAERSELLFDQNTALADTLRNDPRAPSWLKQWTGACRLCLSIG